MKQFKTIVQPGFGLIEIVVVTLLIAVAVPSIWQLLRFTTRTIHGGARQAEATYLAQESIEVVRALRSQSGGWTNHIDALTAGVDYCPEIQGGNSWALTSTTPCTENGYTKAITASTVYRDDVSGNIVDSGCSGCTVDANTRLITATILWTVGVDNRTLSLKAYITNYEDT